ncbi:MAG: hypothetical protein IT342_26810 [Candidatus Melainabacteria bacterium]|mgnify:CR=1 FL=1|nr:hypothetical protein [Candidatus Melainabacteria bacterium]
MPDIAASIGDGAINMASGPVDASFKLAAEANLASPGSLGALEAMTKPMQNTPSIAQFLMKCPLTIG